MLLLALLALMAPPEKIVIDTDPGVFTDDNIAVVMCLRSPAQVEVVGITTVSGNVWAAEGVTNIRRTLELLKQSVPVHLGAQRPLRHAAEQTRDEGPLEFAGAFSRPQPVRQSEDAVDFLIRSLEQEPLTILAIGPLTNLAHLLGRRPDLAARIRRLVIMGGNVGVAGNSSKAAEFNFWFDPEAAQAVLSSPIKEKILFPLDICNQAVVRKAQFDQVVTARTPVTEEYKRAFGLEYPGYLKDPQAVGYLWDELAAGFLIDPSIVTRKETLHLDVITSNGPRYGAMTEGKSALTVMLGLDSAKAFSLVRVLLTRP